MMSVGSKYADLSGVIYDELGETLEKKFRSVENPDDLIKSIMGLNFIIQRNVYHILGDFNKVFRVYQTASSVRLIFECVADAIYLKNNPNESEKYYNSQQQIQADLKAAQLHEEKWKVFKRGEINKYGSLDKSTMSRIKNAYGSDGLGAYNFLCFYSHPNIASAFWLKADEDKGLINLYLIEVLNLAIVNWLTVLTSIEPLVFDGAEWSGRLAEVYADTLGKIKTS